MKPVFRDALPAPALRGWVSRYQIIQLDFRSVAAAPAKAYWPRPACALAFYPRDPEIVSRPSAGLSVTKPRAVLIGQATAMEYRCGGRDFCVFQVEFRPGALFRLTGGLRSVELTDGFVDAEVVLGRDVASAASALSAVDTADAMVPIVDELMSRLVARAEQRRRIDGHAADWAAHQLGVGATGSLSRLADRAGLSTRQLHRSFLDRIGVEPSVFGRIARFDRLLRARNTHHDWDWLSLALDAGYHDHRHMARDFQAFTGLSPSAFYRQELEAPERHFGHLEM
ncbi:helix-turn-helix domain-containing protein [Brevundimonas sp.]|uniref:AraC family transcriptional regulator n=1 Tax=Brevundimonas sp. TaxID=1871086 RepID=UPI002634AC02|nr:helix-turn-helix domain-containing protein [Brevundimonas sp.]